MIDRESAYEKLTARAEQKAQEVPEETRSSGRQPDSLMTSIAKTMLRAAGSQIGRQIVRGLRGSIFGGSGRR